MLFRSAAALVIRDVGTGWLDCYPVPSKSADDTYTALQHAFGPGTAIRSIHSDDAPELKKACRDLGIPHFTGTPGRPNTNSLAERAVKTVLEGTRTVLEHAGLPSALWTQAAKHFCLMRNVVEQAGGSPWEKIGRAHV